MSDGMFWGLLVWVGFAVWVLYYNLNKDLNKQHKEVLGNLEGLKQRLDKAEESLYRIR